MPIRENKNANFVNSRKFSPAKITESTVFHFHPLQTVVKC